MTKITSLLFTGTLLMTSACYENDDVNIKQKETVPSTDELDVYIQEHFVEPYNMAIRYNYVDRYVDQSKRVTPADRENVIPMLTFLQDYWIDPFRSVPNGNSFFKRYVPSEVVFIGSTIYNADGTEILGTADAGARITLSRVNFIDMDDQEWLFLQLGTIYHEFAHVMHQNFKLPPNYQTISPDGYTSSGSWFVLTEEEALERGFVSPYATSSFNEDFAETVAFILYYPDFYERYYTEEENCATVACIARNEGRALIRQKYDAILAHYKQYTGVDLLAVRDIIQEKLND
ncbi:substrate import-associated zinc metallohydrolase lipoprotein [Dawidia cretensis]|nr:substrate import-associated zinc metallohydrolase lipoprotein [Dawidia cretensis]